MGVEIRNAIQAGKEVTFHEARINEHGWSGYGYSIVDPETGAGAYLIEGKGNGGWLENIKSKALSLFNLIDKANTLFGIFSEFFTTFSNILSILESENCGFGIKIQAIISFIGILVTSLTFVALTIAVSGLIMAAIAMIGSYFTSKLQELIGSHWREFCGS
ncbi:hypothetical protein ABFV80_001149 [Vandammella animalimorsus]|uniref:hypothetical protein n=1 Tax=Vandammella animalimorsus TaxID=2029117 RepID=UPI00325BCBA8